MSLVQARLIGVSSRKVGMSCVLKGTYNRLEVIGYMPLRTRNLLIAKVQENEYTKDTYIISYSYYKSFRLLLNADFVEIAVCIVLRIKIGENKKFSVRCYYKKSFFK